MWRVTNGYNGRVYYGDYSTIMIFVFREEHSLPGHAITAVTTDHVVDSWVELYHAINIEKIDDSRWYDSV